MLIGATRNENEMVEHLIYNKKRILISFASSLPSSTIQITSASLVFEWDLFTACLSFTVWLKSFLKLKKEQPAHRENGKPEDDRTFRTG